MQAEGLHAIVSYLEAHPDEFDEDFIRKLIQRGKVIDDPERPNQIVVEVERHRGMLGTRYEKGEPMDSYITYWPRYAFDPQTNKFEEIGPVRPSKFEIGISVEFEMDTSFDIQKLENGSFRVEEGCSNETATVNNLEEAKAFAISIVDAWSLEDDLSRNSDALAPGQSEEFKSIIRQARRDAIVRSIEFDWEHKD